MAFATHEASWSVDRYIRYFCHDRVNRAKTNDGDAVRVGPGNHVLDRGSDPPCEGAILTGKGAAHCKAYTTFHELFSSAVAEMGDRDHNRHGPKRGGLLCPFLAGQLGPRLIQCGLGRGLLRTSVPSGILVHPAV